MQADQQHRVTQWVAHLDAIFLKLSALCCAVIAVMVTVGIVARGFGNPLMFSDEYSSYLMAACAFFALPIVTSQREHLVADFLYRRCGRHAQNWLRLFADFALLAFVLALLAAATRVVWVSYEDGLRSQGLMSSPLWVPQAAMLLGLLFASVSASFQVFAAVRAMREQASAEPPR